MVNTIVDGTFRQTNLTNESSEYLAKREELRLAEIELIRQRERIAELRRNLPEGAPIRDYEFEEGPRDLNAGDAPLPVVSELFTKPNRSLVIYHFMFGKGQTRLARCAPPGSTVLMGSPIISLRILTSLLSLPLISPRCAPRSRAGLGQAAPP